MYCQNTKISLKKWFCLCSQLSFNVIVIVTNVNDNSPVFERDIYHANVSEVKAWHK